MDGQLSIRQRMRNKKHRFEADGKPSAFSIKRKERGTCKKAIKRYFPVFVLPTMIAFTIGFIAPFLLGIYLSFCKFTTVTDARFIGLENYGKVFQDPTFLHSLWYTVLFTVLSMLLINVLAFAVAMVLTKPVRGKIFSGLYFYAEFDRWNYSGIYLAASVKRSACTLGKTLTYSGTYGLMGMIILVCWQQIGYMMIIYISGIQNIPGELIEAAKIDGANSRQVLRKVIIPMVMPSITICTFLTLTNGFKLFDQNLALTNGAPSKMSELLALNIFNTFYGRAGYEGVGQAKAVIFFLIVGLVAVIQNRMTRSKEVQQ